MIPRNGSIGVIALAFLVGACTTNTTTPATSAGSAATTASADWDPPPVSADRAKELFEAVCGGSLPRFSSANKRMAENGISLASPHGTSTVYSARENVSFQIQGSSDARCSMVFKSKDSPATVRAVFTKFGPAKTVNGNLAAPYLGRTVVVAEPARADFHRWFMLSET